MGEQLGKGLQYCPDSMQQVAISVKFSEQPLCVHIRYS